MSVRIASNVISLQAQRRLADATSSLSDVSQKLSSGLRINKASDDAAGLQIAESLKADSQVYSQAIKNVNDGVSLLDIAQGAVQQLSNIVVRQAELAEQSANGVYGNNQRLAIDAEARALTREYNRIVATTSFNGLNTLTGITNSIRLQFGYGTDGGISIGVGNGIGFAAGSGNFGNGSGSANAVYTSSSTAAAALVSADFNGDGILDIASANSSLSNVGILLGNGNGSFRAAVSYSVSDGIANISTGDFNGDGIIDLVIVNDGDNPDATLTVLTGNSDGSFKTQGSLSMRGTIGGALSVADLNNDGFDDIFASDFNSYGASIFYGSGNGTFRPAQTINFVVSNVNYSQIADLNGDGFNDIVVSRFNHSAAEIILGNGDGTYRAGMTYDAGGNSGGIRLGDFNNDGKLDVVSSNYVQGGFAINFGNGDGSFRANVSYTSLSGTVSPVARDINGDGNLDLMFADYGSTNIGVHLGNGNGTFLAMTTFSSTLGAASYSLLVDDFNGDGVLDAITGSSAVTGLSYATGIADSSGRRNNHLEDIDLSSQYGAKQALLTTKATLTRINQELGIIGAAQSRLGSASQTLQVAREGFGSARSQLIDADIAQEAATLSRTRILQKAAVSVLAQANQQPALALRLLKG